MNRSDLHPAKRIVAAISMCEDEALANYLDEKTNHIFGLAWSPFIESCVDVAGMYDEENTAEVPEFDFDRLLAKDLQSDLLNRFTDSDGEFEIDADGTFVHETAREVVMALDSYIEGDVE